MTSKLSLPGSLAIFNALSVVGLAVLARQMGAYQMFGLVWLWILSFPLTMLCYVLLESTRSEGGTVIVLLCVAVGANAILWGHGVAWLLRRTVLGRFAPPPSPSGETDGDPPGGAPPE
jgi:hypothetical protein